MAPDEGETVRHRLLVYALMLALAACARGTQQFSLPPNAAVASPGAHVPPELKPLAGAWTGTWLTPGWGPGYDALLVVEQLDAREATVLYAWGNHPAFNDSGWYRQKALVEAGPRLEWVRGTTKFAFDLSKDRGALSGSVQDAGEDAAFVTLARVPLQPPPPGAPGPRLALPRLPGLPVIPAAREVPPDLAGVLGTWEGTWDSGVVSRLAIREINSAAAMVLYAWSDDPQGGFKADYTRQVALVYGPERALTWGTSPRFTFRLSGDGKTLRGEWEKEGRVSAVLMRKISPVIASE